MKKDWFFEKTTCHSLAVSLTNQQQKIFKIWGKRGQRKEAKMTNFITSETQNQEKQGGGNNLDCASVMGFSLNKEKKKEEERNMGCCWKQIGKVHFIFCFG